jgi:hypothetical protein
MNRAGCLRWGIFVGIGHCLVYGDGYRRGRERPKEVRAALKYHGLRAGV